MANNPLRSGSTTSQTSTSRRNNKSDVARRRDFRNAPANSSGGVNTAFGTRPVTPLEDLDLAPHRLFGRAVTQGIQSVDPILRGLYSIGKSAYQGLEKPIFSGLDAAGLDVGDYGEKVLETESMGPELAKEFGKSFFLETPSTLADLAYLPNLLFSGKEAADARLGGRLQELSDEPFMFGLEHVGNAAIAGAVAARPMQLGIAASRGSLSPAAARGGMMPVTGRGARVTARHATRQAAEEGSRSARTAMFLEDVVGHPYMAAGRGLKNSYPGQLLRNPLPREEIFTRISEGLRGRMDELVQNEEGALNFRKEDPRREYNDLFESIAKYTNRMEGYPEGHEAREMLANARMRAEVRQGQLRRELRSRGIEVDEHGPISMEGVDPSDLVAERDFSFDEGGGTFSADGFWQSMSGPLRRKLDRTAKKVEPDTVDFEPHISSTLDEPSADFYKTNADGEVVGVLTVYPDDIHVAVHPGYRRQGIAKQMVERALEAGVPLERIVTSPNSGVSTSQYGTVLLEWGRQALVENPGRFQNKGIDPRFDNSGPIGSMDDTLGYLDDLDDGFGGFLEEANDLDELRRQMPGASDAEILRAYQRAQDVAEGRAPRDWEIPAEEAELVAEFQRRMPHLSMHEINRLIDQHGDAALDIITEEMSGPSRGRGREPAQARPEGVRGETRNHDRPDMPIEVMESGAFRNPRTGEYFDSRSEALDSVYVEEGSPYPLRRVDEELPEDLIVGEEDLIDQGIWPESTQGPRETLPTVERLGEGPQSPRHNPNPADVRYNDGAWRLLDGTELSPTGRDTIRNQIGNWTPPEGMRGFIHRSQITIEDGKVYDALTGDLLSREQIHPNVLEPRRELGISDEVDPVVRTNTRQLRNMGVNVFDPAMDRTGFIAQRNRVAEGVTSGAVQPEIQIRVVEGRNGGLGFQIDDGTHRFLAAEAGLIPDDLAVKFVTDSMGTPARGNLLQRAREHFLGANRQDVLPIRQGEVFYHGTRRADAAASIRSEGFRPSSTGEQGRGTYVTRDRDYAERFPQEWQGDPYGAGHYEQVGEVLELNLDDAKILDRSTPEGERIFREAEDVARQRGDRQAVGEVLREQGYDGSRRVTGGDEDIVIYNQDLLNRNFEDAVTGVRNPSNNTGTPDVTPVQSQEAIAGRELLDALSDLLRSEEGSISIFGSGRQKLGNRIGLVDFTANEAGLALRRVLDSPGFERVFGPEAKMSKFIRSDLIKSITRGDGVIANQLEELISEQMGNVNLRRRWDPARTEQLFIRDLDNMAKRPDAANYTDLLADIAKDRPDVRTLPKRTGQVLIGSKAAGRTLNSEQLVRQVDRVLQYAREVAGGDQARIDSVLRDMLPGVEPMGMYLMALNGIEKLKGLPDNSLTGALGDYITMDRFGDLNRRAQEALGSKAAEVTGERFSLPPEAIGVDLTTLPENHQRLFHEAAAEYRSELGRVRERQLLDSGFIRSEAGTRAGLAADQPTRFSTELDDLPLDPSSRSKVETTRKAVEQQEIRLSQARQEHVAREQAKLDAGVKLLDELEQSLVMDSANAPVSARNLLTYANEVAPRQARVLRQLAEEGVGDPKVMENLAKELEAVPKTLEDLNSSEVYLAYLKDIKDVGTTEPTGIGVRHGIDTRSPTKRRGTATDIEYSRDFRSRAYWQDSEFQSYFMSRQADQMVREHGLAKTGRQRLLDAGWSEAAIGKLSRNRVQQELERLKLRTYDPSNIFPSGRKPMQGLDPLDAEWINPWVEKNLLTAIKEPNGFERFMQGTFDPAQQAWKVAVLPLRLAWQVNNMAGGSLLLGLQGKVSPMDFPALMRASYKAVQDYNRGIPSQIRFPLKDSYRAELVAKLNTLDAADPHRVMIKNMLDEGSINLSNEVLADIADNGLLRGDFAFMRNSQFAQDVGARPKSIFKQYGVDMTLPENLGGEKLRLGSRVRNIKRSGRQAADFGYHVNTTVDNMHRTMVYLDQIGKGANPEQALAQVAKTLGDYSKLSPLERGWVKRIYPFYPWMKHITTVVASAFEAKNMTRSVIFAHLMSIFGEPNEWEELLPEYASGHIFMGLDEDGKPKFLSTRGLNPFLDVFDPVSQPNFQGLIRPTSPVIQYAYEKLSGTSVLTGRPISSPTGDPEARPPLSEYFFRNIPQAGVARDIYRDMTDQPLTRYGTGEPAFFEGATERSGLDSLSQLFGVNIRTIDVESQKNSERVREYQEEVRRRRHEEQKNSQGGGGIMDLLESLPGLGGGGSQPSGSRSNPLR